MMFTGTADGRVLKSENGEIETDHREVDWGQACAKPEMMSLLVGDPWASEQCPTGPFMWLTHTRDYLK